MRLDRGMFVAAVAGLAVLGLAACKVEKGGLSAGDEAVGGSGSRPVADAPAGPATDPSGTAVLVTDTRPGTTPGGVETPRPAVVPTSPPANVTYGEAERVFRSGDYVEAADLFEAYAVRRPENPWGHYMLGISAWRARDHGRAEAALRRTLEVDSTHEKGLLNLARVLLEQRKASDALEYAERVVARNPESGEGWRVLGNARSDLGLVDAAVEAYRSALVLDHRDAWTMNNLGLLMIREGRYDEALPPLARATELRPDVAMFQNNLGVALERSGYVAEAAEAFGAALVANPEYEKAQVSLERVEARAPSVPEMPLDLTALAGLFADEVEIWKRQSSESKASEQEGSEPLVPVSPVIPEPVGRDTAASEPSATEPGGTIPANSSTATGHGC